MNGSEFLEFLVEKKQVNTTEENSHFDVILLQV